MNSFKMAQILSYGAKNRIGLNDHSARQKLERELAELRETAQDCREDVALEVADVIYFLSKAVFCGALTPEEADLILKENLPPWMDGDLALDVAILKYQYRVQFTKDHAQEVILVNQLLRQRGVLAATNR